MSGIFISYRRGQAGGYAGRMADDLGEHFGKNQIFRDIEAISAGADFVEAIDRAVGSCDALIAVITPDWVNATDSSGRRRLDNPEDFVRVELERALRRSTYLIPVLVGGATMPGSDELPEPLKPLARRQAHEMRDASWDYNLNQLIKTLEKRGLEPERRSRPGPAPEEPTRGRAGMSGRTKLALGAAGAVVAVLTLVVLSGNEGPGTRTAEPALSAPAASYGSGVDARDTAPSKTKPAPPAVKSGSAASGEVASGRPPATRSDPNSAYRSELIAAVNAASEAEVRAVRDLDSSPLFGRYDEDALDLLLGAIQELAANQISMRVTSHGRKFVAFDVSADGSDAEVELVETWSAELYSNMLGMCVGRIPRHDLPQTLYLYRVGGSWVIHDVEFHAASPDAQPC